MEDSTPINYTKQKESQMQPTKLDSSALMFSIKNQTGFYPKNRTRFVDKHKNSLLKQVINVNTFNQP
jgi:hypothetical protein